MLNKSQLEENLETLDFRPDSPEYGLLFVNAPYKDDISISFGERLVLRDAKLMGASAVYFRRADRKETLPQLFVFDNTGSKFSEEALVQVHKKIWTSGIVPLYYVFDKTSLRVFDGKKRVKVSESNELFVKPIGDAISLIADAHTKYKRYSAKLFQNGAFWEQKENKNRFLHDESSINFLIQHLRQFKRDFTKEVGKKLEVLANKLLVQSILVKYLEELRDEDGNPGYESDFFTKYDGAENFCEVIRKKNIVPLFDELSRHFNGKIFELTETEKAMLLEMDLSSLADFLNANITPEGQYTFWRFYEFRYLPVEVISRIYEEFLTERSDAVYTPVHLAKFMVDECMPVDEPKKNFKIIDVSCGSGVFLVTVFRRLAQWRQLDEYTKTREIKTPDQEILKELILNSIYGVDIEENAIRLAAFSLSIALCEMLTPMDIWKNLKFDDLSEKNLYTGDFFKYLGEQKKPYFDLVIGNPPFEDQSKIVDPAIRDNSLDILCKIPRNQKAILFLDQAMKLLKKEGMLSLVMPSAPLLYNSTSAAEYRKTFFERYAVPQIVDFTRLNPKKYLFESHIGTAVVFAMNASPKKNGNVLHITVHRSKSAKERLYFEIDHYDLHWIPQKIAASDPVIWKANLFGGGHLYYLIKQLMEHRTFGDFLRDKKNKDGWFFGEGYTVGNGSKKAEWLTGCRLVEAAKFTENGIETSIESTKLFYRIIERNKKIFKAPHLLIRQILSKNKFVAAALDYDLIFKQRVIGIHAPNSLDELKEIELFLQRNYKLFKVFLSVFSSRSGVTFSPSTLLMEDFMKLPYPKNESELKLFQNDQIIVDDFLDYRLEAHKKGERAKVNILEANKEQLDDFADVFCRNLNSVYEENGKSFHALRPVETDSAICFPFAYGKEYALPSIPADLKDGDLKSLLKEKYSSVIYNRVVYFHQLDMIYLIKPKKLRYWLKSVALRDVSEVMNNFAEAGF